MTFHSFIKLYILPEHVRFKAKLAITIAPDHLKFLPDAQIKSK